MTDGQTFVVVGCGKAKQPRELVPGELRVERYPLRELYTSTYFRKKRAYAEAVGDQWTVLSAHHGIRDPGEEFEPYDVSIDDLREEQLDALAHRVGMVLVEWIAWEDDPVDTIVVLAGTSSHAIRFASATRSARASSPASSSRSSRATSAGSASRWPGWGSASRPRGSARPASRRYEMALSAFPYVGGKTRIAKWIIGHLPEHTVYVEPFGGSAAVLLNKPRSDIEVFNDLDGDVVQFFEVARDRPDELEEWASRTPYSEELHSQWVREFYEGERPDDPIKRAGRFLFLRYTQYAGKYGGPSGFKRDTPRTRVGESTTWKSVPDRIDEVCRRLQGVSIQNRDFAEVIDHYDREDVAFCVDPPYLDKEDSYRVTDFEHSDLARALDGIDGYALVSYTDLPEGHYQGWTEVTRGHYHDSGARKGQDEEKVTERLLCNFDPSEVPEFSSSGQMTLGEVEPRA